MKYSPSSSSLIARCRAWWHEAYQQNPIMLLLCIAFIPRLLAVFFAKGYAMSDDHFTLQDVSWHWFLPNWGNWFYNDGTGDPPGHSIAYPFINHCLMRFSVLIGMEKPQEFMLVIRFVHALYSLIVVYASYRIAEELTQGHECSKAIAWRAGLSVALLWIMPFMSVRNLIEIICIPPLMMGLLYVLRAIRLDSARLIVVAGMCFGLAFVFRYQTIVMTGVVGLLLLTRYNVLRSILFGMGAVLVATAIHGTADWLIWGKPFAQFLAYTKYNATHGNDYTSGAWYNYLLLVIGLLVPPTSLILLYRLVRHIGVLVRQAWQPKTTQLSTSTTSWQNAHAWLYVVLPALAFIVVHSFYPNKQERFILPAIPALLTACVVAWYSYRERGRYARALMVWYWVINTCLLVLFTLTYSKKARVETLTWLSERDDLHALLVDGVRENAHLPIMYLYRSPLVPRTLPIITTENDGVVGDSAYMRLRREIDSVQQNHTAINYVLVIGMNDHSGRVERLQRLLRKHLQPQRTITPSLLDDIVYRLNPKYNVNLTSIIYKVVE